MRAPFRDDGEESSRRRGTTHNTLAALRQNFALGADVGFDPTPIRQKLSSRHQHGIETERLRKSGQFNGWFRSIHRSHFRLRFGIAACFDLDGNKQWMTRIYPGELTYGSSPALADGVLVTFLNRLYGFDVKTGEQLWEQPKVRQNVAALMAAKLPDLDAHPQTLEQWRGKVIVVNFWATWCAPCREEIPALVKFQRDFGPKGVQIVGIAIDAADKVRPYAANMKMNYPILIGDADGVELVQRAGNPLGGLPFTVILDRRGNAVHSHLGSLTADKLLEVIQPLL